MTIAPRWLAVTAAVTISACAPPQMASYSAPPQQDDDSALVVGMTLDQVEDRWGDTDCVYERTIEGQTLDAIAYGLDASTSEVVGIPDCSQARVTLLFSDGRLIAWGEYQ